MTTPGKLLLFTLVFLGVLRLDAAAYAYLDPGTGSMLIQMVLGGVAGLLVVGKLYWSRIKAFFGRGLASGSKREPVSDSDAE